MQTTGPYPLVLYLLARSPDKVVEAARTHRASLSYPLKTPGEYLSSLRKSGLEAAADSLGRSEEAL